MWGKLSWKIFVLVICKILGNLVKTLTTDDKYSLHNSEILWQPIQMQLSKKKNDLLLILFFISEIYINVLTFCKKNMALRAYIFPKLQSANPLVR